MRKKGFLFLGLGVIAVLVAGMVLLAVRKQESFGNVSPAFEEGMIQESDGNVSQVSEDDLAIFIPN